MIDLDLVTDCARKLYGWMRHDIPDHPEPVYAMPGGTASQLLAQAIAGEPEDDVQEDALRLGASVLAMYAQHTHAATPPPAPPQTLAAQAADRVLGRAERAAARAARRAQRAAASTGTSSGSRGQ